MRPRFEVADVIRRLGVNTDSIGLNSWQLRTLSALRICRTAQMGGHIDSCDSCGKMQLSYNSCRNRHCPKCQGHLKERWMEARMAELLPTTYFHVVFTLPNPLNTVAIKNPSLLYSLLFDAAWQTIHAFANQKGLLPGMIAILHTWGQNLSLHPHLHCIVPGGGINHRGTWSNIRKEGKFLFPVQAMSKVFRGKFLSVVKHLRLLDQKEIDNLYATPWIVYAKRPFGGSRAVVEYLGRYTHKIAISNHRIREVDDTDVVFDYKDYKACGVKKQMRLSHAEFIRRFSQHILPKRFVRIRHYGFLSSTWKRNKLKALQRELCVIEYQNQKIKSVHKKCPCCKTGNLVTILVFDKRGPPDMVFGRAASSVACDY